MSLPTLGNPCTITIRGEDGRRKWGTTHPNKEPGSLAQYLMDLTERWHVGDIVKGGCIIERKVPLH